MDATTLTDESLRQLVTRDASPCVSIYIPVVANDPQQEQCRIRLKNQLNAVERTLQERGVAPAEIESTLKPLRAVADSLSNDRVAAAGLALLRSQEAFEILELPDTPPELGLVDDALVVTPLVELVNLNERFRLLALTQNEVRLLTGTRHTLSEVNVPNLPPNLAAALRDDDDANETLQFHTEATDTVGERPAVFHGQAVGDEHAKERVQRFCQLIAGAVDGYFDDQDVPLVLAGAEPIASIYRQVSKYKTLLDDTVAGDPRQLRDDELHERAWQIIEPRAIAANKQHLAALHEGLAKDRCTLDVASALDAARVSRVDTLFVNRNSAATSQRRPDSDAAATATQTATGIDINRAVVETLRHGGNVFVAAPQDLPDDAPVGAIYRY